MAVLEFWLVVPEVFFLPNTVLESTLVKKSIIELARAPNGTLTENSN